MRHFFTFATTPARRTDAARRLKRPVSLLLLVLISVPAWSNAPDDDADDAVPLTALRDQIEAGQAGAALKKLLTAAEADPDNADLHNLLGFAYRHLNEFATSRDHYDRALAIDPEHKGALEYLGELELGQGNVEAAQRLLIRLEQLCPASCEELDELREAFAGLPATTTE